jgi:hypothetical protein
MPVRPLKTLHHEMSMSSFRSSEKPIGATGPHATYAGAAAEMKTSVAGGLLRTLD